MFKSLKLWNFQAHRQLEIEFAPGVTTIKGPTDTGKSAVLRALRWVCLNDLGGEDFITWGRKEVVADLVTDAGRVSRRKGKQNVYKLNGQVFRAIAAGKVPDSISAVLGVNEINFQRQFDPHFWLASSAPEVSRQLNRVIDLAVIDESLGKISGFVRFMKERVAVTEERLIEKRAAYEAAKLGTERIKRFKVLAAEYEGYEKTTRDYYQLEGIINQVGSYQIKVLERKVSGRATILEEAGKLWAAETEGAVLNNLRKQLETAQAASTPLPDFKPLKDAWERFRLLQIKETNLAQLEIRIKRQAGSVEEWERIYTNARAAVARNACPVCGRKNL